MLDYVYFAGKNFDEFKTFITNAGVYNAPAHGYDSISIAGRNGNLIFDKDNYDNVEHSYPIVITEDFDVNFSALKSFLLSKKGYQRLADSFNPDVFYMATFSKFNNIKQKFLHGTMGTCVLVFERKPQKYLKSGEDSVTFNSSSYIKNPTRFDALPLIRVYGSGTLTIGDISIVISTTENYLDIDCELQEVLQSGGNLDITLTNGKFPKLAAGVNEVTFTGLTKIDLIPRWWTI